MKKIAYLLILSILCGSVMTACVRRVEEKKVEDTTEEIIEEERTIASMLRAIETSEYKESKYTQEDVDSETVQWICASYAILVKVNRGEFGVIAGLDENETIYVEETKDKVRDMLQSSWGIEDRRSTAQTVRRLLTKGQRERYNEEAQAMLDNREMGIDVFEKYGDTPEAYRMDAIQKAYKEFGPKALDAWDLTRANHVLAYSYFVGYINLEECLDISLWIAESLQMAFDSWDEVAMSYLFGHQFWAKDDPTDVYSESMKRYKVYEQIKDLAIEGEGPYTIPFDAELVVTWGDEEAIEANREARRIAEEERKAEEERYDRKPTQKGADGYLTIYRYFYQEDTEERQEVSAKLKLPNGFKETKLSDDQNISARNEEWDALLTYDVTSFTEENDLDDFVHYAWVNTEVIHTDHITIDSGEFDKDGMKAFFYIGSYEVTSYYGEDENGDFYEGEYEVPVQMLNYKALCMEERNGEWLSLFISLEIPNSVNLTQEKVLELLFADIKF